MQYQKTTSDDITFNTAMILYSVLFIVGHPISKYELMSKLDIPEVEFDNGLETLKKFLLHSSPLFIQEIEDKIVIGVRPEFSDYIKTVTKHRKTKLTQESLETLAIIAYKQPITKKEIDRIRGIDSEKTLDTLLKHGLIKIIGNIKSPGLPLLYQTTDIFLLSFGLSSLADLPKLEDFITAAHG